MYERGAIKKWLFEKRTSPSMNLLMDGELIPATQLKTRSRYSSRAALSLARRRMRGRRSLRTRMR